MCEVTKQVSSLPGEDVRMCNKLLPILICLQIEMISKFNMHVRRPYAILNYYTDQTLEMFDWHNFFVSYITTWANTWLLIP